MKIWLEERKNETVWKFLRPIKKMNWYENRLMKNWINFFIRTRTRGSRRRMGNAAKSKLVWTLFSFYNPTPGIALYLYLQSGNLSLEFFIVGFIEKWILTKWMQVYYTLSNRPRRKKFVLSCGLCIFGKEKHSYSKPVNPIYLFVYGSPYGLTDDPQFLFQNK